MNNCIVSATLAISLAISPTICTQTSNLPSRSPDLLAELPATSKQPKGFSMGTSLLWRPNTELDTRLNRAKMLGNSIRVDIDWAVIQPDKNGPYDWRETDRVIGAATRRGLGIVAMVGFTPSWARNTDCASSYGCAPTDPAAYASFAKDAAAHYSNYGVKRFELWNEPNSPWFYGPTSDPTSYAALVTQASAAIKATVPDAKVAIGGIAPGYNGGPVTPPVTFLKQLYDAGATGFDAVALHPYNLPALPSQQYTWNAFTQIEGGDQVPGMPTIYDTMAEHGDGAKEIWLTEYGAPTSGTGNQATSADQRFADFDDTQNSYVSEELQARMVDDFMYYKFKRANVTVRMMYELYDTAAYGQSPASSDYYGLYRKDGTAKPAITTFLKR